MAGSYDIVIEFGTPKSCSSCKWGNADFVNPLKGNCVGAKNHMGGIWKRLIKDYYNTTCGKYEEGDVNFRDHV